MTAPRKCPNCGVLESRWVVGGRDCVNLDPITGNCITCLSQYAKEAQETKRTLLFDALPFDPKAAAANDRGEA